MRMSAADLLEARIAAAYALREFDQGSRRMNVKKLIGQPLRERNAMAATLTALGGEPWPYSPDVDNSWLL